MSIYYFSKNCFVMKHYGENEIPIFFPKIRFFFFLANPNFSLENPNFSLENPNFSLENPNFSLENPIFFESIQNLGGCPLPYTTFRKHRNPVFGHFPSFPASSFMPRVINIPSISDTMWCKAGFILRTPQYADRTAQKNLRRYARMYAYCRSVYTRHLRDPYGVDRHQLVTGETRPKCAKWSAYYGIRRRFAFEL